MEVGIFYAPVIGPASALERGMAGQDTALYQTMLAHLVEQARYLDQHGYYGIAFTEHHLQVEGITVSNNPVMLDHYIAARTERIRVGQLGLVLPPANPLRVAEDVGVMLLVEPEPGLLVENAEQFFELTKRIDSPMFGLNFDVGHFYCVSEPLPETVARFSSWTQHFHLEDIAATRVHEHLIPGHGAINFNEVLSAIRKSDFDGWLTVELYPYLEDPDAAGREALEYFRKLDLA